MRFTETPIAGAWIIDLERKEDERGFFARTFSVDEFAAHGLPTTFVQANTSFNHRQGTLRGLHWQDERAPEAKLVRCIRGAIVDVIVDMRPESATFRQHVLVELRADERRQVLIPERCAAGYQTLEDDTEVAYLVTGMYTPAAERGARYDDPRLAIPWPLPVDELSPKDAAWPPLTDEGGPA
jgi:dTDP-4-dehydrorhamnose 3,5-epimerase